MKHHMKTDEAFKIMGFESTELNKAILEERYKKLFAANDPDKGGSFYLQSKVYRSKEVLDDELRKKIEQEIDQSKAKDAGAEGETEEKKDKGKKDNPE